MENNKTNKEINVMGQDIIELFKQEKIFKVEFFQRKYNWKKETIEDLLNELLEEIEFEKDTIKKKKYFLGNIILKNNENEISIIDGQQRITTLFLILRSIEKVINDKSETSDKKAKDKIAEIKSIYSFIDNESNEIKLKVSELSNFEELKLLLLNGELKKDEEESFRIFYYKENFNQITNWIKTKLSTKERIYRFYNKIKSIIFSVTYLNKNINEFKVFEDFNAKGESLGIEDLLRNYFSKKFNEIFIDRTSNVDHNDKDFVKKKVERLEKIIKKTESFLANEKKEQNKFNEKINRWFRVYLRYKFLMEGINIQVSEENELRMYKKYKEIIDFNLNNAEQIDNEIDLIGKFLSFCKKMNQNFDYEELEDINIISFLNEVKFYPFLFWITNEIKIKENIIKILKMIFVFVIYKIPSGKNLLKDFSSDYFSEMKRIYREEIEDFEIVFKNFRKYLTKEIGNINDNNYESIINVLEKELIDMINLDIYNKDDIKNLLIFIFSQYENVHYYNKVKDRKYNFDHVIPRNSNDSTELNKYEINIRAYSLNKIQNLCFMEAIINSNAENFSYKEKREEILEETKLKIPKIYFKKEVIDEKWEEENKNEIIKIIKDFAKSLRVYLN